MKIKLKLEKDDGTFAGEMQTDLDHDTFNIISRWIRRQIKEEYKIDPKDKVDSQLKSKQNNGK